MYKKFKIISIVGFVILVQSLMVNAQVVSIPDSNFKAALVADVSINTNSDSEIQTTEAASFTGSLNVSGLGITNLTGIEAFTSLTALLCGNNSLTNLNVSLNTALTSLECNSNQLTSIDVSTNIALNGLNCSYNSITSLNVSSNTSLTYLNCGNNQLTSLNVSSNTALTELYCNVNLITSLDVSTSISLTNLNAFSNQLTSLNVSANTSLTSLYCNSNQLIALNIKNGNNINLGFFSASTNPNLSCIQVDDVSFMSTSWASAKDAGASYNTDCSSSCTVNIPNANFRTYLLGNSSINTNADGFIQCSEASTYTGAINVYASNISDLTGIGAFIAITDLNCGDNQLTSLDISANTAITFLNCGANQLTSLNVTANTALNILYCNSNQLTSMNLTANTALTNFQCNSNQVVSLDVSANISLTTLICSGNPLTSLDVSSNTALIVFDCNNNLLTNLNVSANTALTQLYCYNNQLTSLILPTGPAFTQVYCQNNQLTSLNISACTALANSNFSNNQLTSLNIKNGNNINFGDFNATGNSGLTCILVDNAAFMNTNWAGGKDSGATYSECCIVTIPDSNFKNYLLANPSINTNSDGEIQCSEATVFTGSINVSSLSINDLTGIEAFTVITSLNCSFNQLTTINISSLTSLTSLNCEYNQLTSIDLSSNTALTSIEIGGNQLASLNINSNTLISNLNCSNNQLTNLSLNTNTALNYLHCNNNLLTSLDVSLNTSLIYLNIFSNQITNLDVSSNTSLTSLNCYENKLGLLNVSFNTSLTTLNCYTNLLTSLNIKNGNNINLSSFDAKTNAGLNCILVDSAAYMNSNWPVAKDVDATYSNICSACTVSSTNPQSICGGSAYAIEGNLYNASGIYNDTLVSSTGCDSIVTTQLTVLSNGFWYIDSDNDSYGDTTAPIYTCVQPQGYVNNNIDCNDADSLLTYTIYYADMDGDNYGNPLDSMMACVAPSGYVIDNSDCDDADPVVNPSIIWYADIDNDSYGDINSPSNSCIQPAGFVGNSLDCNDNDVLANPFYTTTNPQSICFGNSYNINGNSYTIAGNYYDTLQSFTSCDSVVLTQLTVNVLPTLSISASSTSICRGLADSLLASSNTIVSYNWSPASGLNSTTIANPIATPGIATNYLVVVTDINGCQAADSLQINVNNAPSLTGTINIMGNAVSTGKLFVYKNNMSVVGAADSTTISNGLYNFISLDAGNYFIRAVADIGAYPFSIPTYPASNIEGNTHRWDSSTVWNATCATNGVVNFNVIDLTPPVANGATVGGVIWDDTDTTIGNRFGSRGIRKPGEPVKGVGVIIQRRPGGNASMRTTTDTTGNYNFANVEIGYDYDLFVEMPSGVMLNTYAISVVSETQDFQNLNFFVDSLSGRIDTVNVNADSVFSTRVISTSGLAQSSIKIYPNPLTQESKLSLSSLRSEEITMNFLDLIGRNMLASEIIKLKPGENLIPLNESYKLPPGVYMISLTGESFNGKIKVLRH